MPMVAERVSNGDRARFVLARVSQRAGLKTRRLQSTISRGTRIMKPVGWAIGSHPNVPDRIVKSEGSHELPGRAWPQARKRGQRAAGRVFGSLDPPGQVQLMVAIFRRAGWICMGAG